MTSALMRVIRLHRVALRHVVAQAQRKGQGKVQRDKFDKLRTTEPWNESHTFGLLRNSGNDVFEFLDNCRKVKWRISSAAILSLAMSS
jgi:hypothetical protein